MEYMAQKQIVYSMPIFFCNESKNEDCINIMRKYEEYLVDAHNKAYGMWKVILLDIKIQIGKSKW